MTDLTQNPALPFVVAIVPTYRRLEELGALLEILAQVPGLGALVVADNAADPAAARLVADAPEPLRARARYLAVEGNPGAPVAMNRAAELALAEWGRENITYFWVMDDDVRFAPDTLARLLAALERADAAIAAPTLLSPAGEVFDWPTLRSPALAQRAESLRAAGPERFAAGWAEENNDGSAAALPEFKCCAGTCWLFERRCRDALGGWREDFWLLGDDIEYSARLAQHFRTVFCPDVLVTHYWGVPLDPRAAERSAYLKACAALQNNLVMCLHLPHTRFRGRALLGSLKRFAFYLRSPAAWADLASMLWHGGGRARAAGTASGKRLRERRKDYEPWKIGVPRGRRGVTA